MTEGRNTNTNNSELSVGIKTLSIYRDIYKQRIPIINRPALLAPDGGIQEFCGQTNPSKTPLRASHSESSQQHTGASQAEGRTTRSRPTYKFGARFYCRVYT